MYHDDYEDIDNNHDDDDDDADVDDDDYDDNGIMIVFNITYTGYKQKQLSQRL